MLIKLDRNLLQNFIDAVWPFIERANHVDRAAILCGRYDDNVPLSEAIGEDLTVGDLRKIVKRYNELLDGSKLKAYEE